MQITKIYFGHFLLLAFALLVFGFYFFSPAQITTNQIFQIVPLALLGFSLFSYKSLKLVLSEFKKREFFVLLIVALLVRLAFSLFNYSHINYHGSIFLSSIIRSNFTQPSLPYGFTYPVLYAPFASFFKIYGAQGLFVVNLLINSFSSLLIFFLSFLCFEKKSLSYAAFILFCISPLQVRYAATESIFNIGIFLFLLFFCSFFTLKKTGDVRHEPVLVLIAVILFFLRPEFILAVSFLSLFFLFFIGRYFLKDIFGYFLCFLSFLLIFYWPATYQIPKLFMFYNAGQMSGKGVFPPSLLDFLPLTFVGLGGCLLALFSPRWRFKAIWALSFIGIMVAMSPHPHMQFEVGAFYLSYLEFILIIGFVGILSYILSHLRNLKLFYSFSIVFVFLCVFQFVWALPYIRALYDEQVEFDFFKRHYRFEMGRVFLITGGLTPVKRHELFNKLEQNLLEVSFPAMTLSPHYGVFFRSLALGIADYDALLEKNGYVPLDVLSFSYQPRFLSFDSGEKLTIGFYRKSNSKPH